MSLMSETVHKRVVALSVQSSCCNMFNIILKFELSLLSCLTCVCFFITDPTKPPEAPRGDLKEDCCLLERPYGQVGLELRRDQI